MRISTQSFYEQSQAAMSTQQANLLRVQQQIGANTKILAPSDDPIAATRALATAQAISLNGQYASSRNQVKQTLSLEGNILDSVTNIYNNIKSLVVQGGNGSLSDSDRASIATTLQSNYDQLLGLANTADGNGQFIFAGFQSGTPPFVKQADGAVAFVGDQGQRLMQVDASRQMAATDDGRSIFQSVQGGARYVTSSPASNNGTAVFGSSAVTDATDVNFGKDFSISFSAGKYTVTTIAKPPEEVATGTFVDGAPITFGGVQISVSGTPADGDKMNVSTAKNAGSDIFSALGDVISALRKPIDNGTSADRTQLLNSLSTVNVKLANSLDNVLTVSASVGSRLNEVDALDNSGSARNISDQSYLSDLQDLDVVKASVELAQRQVSLQATQLAFMKIQKISLMNYL
ncbi:flagellar hook-associated protein FlgL [Glaciimonas sp. GNP009]|uniref:flagellar hook-associated protein FlgL n=2 Tax=Glaciimonas sp. CA11.2 TaxID=3048601 RepID=UPI002AB51123|nr:flagellar hook-associated protein FlgL [Glaciimonas sp. CA11.2]MDY7548727.1 flagellar hook-associated protein FlgL [Glaciimonas sp. CA11.2]